jgi:hypothetical protein
MGGSVKKPQPANPVLLRIRQRRAGAEDSLAVGVLFFNRLLGLVYVEQEAHYPGESTILLAVMMTVLLSIFAHGASAAPGVEIYARRIAALGADSPEREGPERSPPPAAAIARRARNGDPRRRSVNPFPTFEVFLRS